MDGWKVLGKVEVFEKPKSKKIEILGKIMDEMKARTDESRNLKYGKDTIKIK
jgi:hypothetical protein